MKLLVHQTMLETSFVNLSLPYKNKTGLDHRKNTSAMAYYPLRAWVAVTNPDIQELLRLIDGASLKGSLFNDSGEDDEEIRIQRLEEPARTEYGEWVSTPLLRAIKLDHVEHVRVLLEAGVDASGVAVGDMLRYVLGMSADEDSLRGTFVDVDEGEMLSRLRKQEQPANAREIFRRRDGGKACPFWGHPDQQNHQFSGKDEILPEQDVDIGGNVPVSSLTVSAWCGRPEIIDLLLQHGADTTSWMHGDDRRTEIEPSCSHLSLITPLHAANAAGHPETIRHLLNHGFNPNAIRKLAPEGAISALQYSIIKRWRTGSSAFEILAKDRRSDFSQRTPHLQVSNLHFAAATLDRHLLEQVLTHYDESIDLSAHTTALGHTVLHVACMTATDADLKFYSSLVGPAVQESIHHCRGITPLDGDGHMVNLQAQHRLQSDIVRFLLERHQGNTAELLMQQDVFENTPLHYLAAAHQPNEDLLDYLMSDNAEVLESWSSSVNEKGYSPRALYGTNE